MEEEEVEEEVREEVREEVSVGVREVTNALAERPDATPAGARGKASRFALQPPVAPPMLPGPLVRQFRLQRCLVVTGTYE
jgi:hypothetical protein